MSSNSTPSPNLNPYQSPADAIDFVEVDDTGRDSKSSPRPRTIEALRETRPWVKLIGGFGAFSSGLASLAAVVGLLRILGSDEAWAAVIWPILNLSMAVIYLTGAILLLRYASSISDLLISGHPDHLDAAVEAQKSFWRFVGIAFTATLLLATCGIVFFFIAAGVSSFLP